MQTILLYALCSASLYYLGSRALITQGLWSRYSPPLALFMDCAACTGTWYGAILAYVGGYHLDLSFMGLPGDNWTTVVASGLASMATTPIVAGLMQHSLETLGHAAPLDDAAEAMPNAQSTEEAGRTDEQDSAP